MNLKTAVFLVTALLAVPAQADDASRVTMHAVYLDAPTEWCAADAGIPTIVMIDGPDLYGASAKPAEKSTVKVRKGGAMEKVEVGRTDVSEFRIGRGTESRTQARLFPREDETSPIGRFSGRVHVCETFWVSDGQFMDWDVIGDEGDVVLSGETKLRFWERRTHPIFNWSSRHPRAYRLGELTVVVMAEPQIETTFEVQKSSKVEAGQ